MRKFDTDNIPAILITICVLSFLGTKYFFPNYDFAFITKHLNEQSISVTFPAETMEISSQSELTEYIDTFRVTPEYLSKFDKEDDVKIHVLFMYGINKSNEIEVRLTGSKIRKKLRYRSVLKKITNNFIEHVALIQANKQINKD